MPYLVHGSIKHVNPRNATALPVNDVTASGTIDPTSYVLTPAGNPVLTASMVDAGIHLTGNSLDYFTSILAYSPGPPATLTLKNIPAAASVNFAIENYVYYEPTWYVTNLGDLYFGANQKPLFHSSLGSRWNNTTQSLVDLTLGQYFEEGLFSHRVEVREPYRGTALFPDYCPVFSASLPRHALRVD